MVVIPESFRRHMLAFQGDEGAAWLQRLPSIVSECAKRWSLSVLPPVTNLSYNYVAPAVRSDGLEVILKVGVITSEFTTEIEALRLYNGRGIAQLLAVDNELGALLLERLQPGIPLFDTIEDDEQATRIAARVMHQLWQPAPVNHTFPTTTDWAAGLNRLRIEFGGTTGPFPKRLVEQAETLFRELHASQAASMLLHGDLHHWNILTAERQPWLAIDPKGVVGEAAYEVGALIRNPMPYIYTRPNLGRMLERRIDILVEELGFDRERMIGWSLAQAVLSGWWSFEDSVQSSPQVMVIAEQLAKL
jgi:streptomycin 6-kinase